MSKYLFNGTHYGKGRLVLAVVKQYVEDNSSTSFSGLEKIFPKSCQSASLKGKGVLGVFTTIENAKEIAQTRKRHFLRSEELIKLEDDSIIAVCTQWGIGNIDKFIEIARVLGYQISE